MKLDNVKRAGKIKLLYLAVPFATVVTTALVYLSTDTKDFIWAVIAGLVLLLFFIIMFIIRYYYIIFYAGPDKVRLRYKSLSPFPTQNNSIQVESSKFYGYKIIKSLFGIRRNIKFFIKTPGGIAAYPKTSISALSASETKQITKALDLIIQLNKENSSDSK